jgi:hypothetical protein
MILRKDVAGTGRRPGRGRNDGRAGTASALGSSYDGGAGDATTVGWGAAANASEGNQALAVSLFDTANADANVSGPNKTGNTMVAVGLISPANVSVQGNPSGNTYLAIDSDIQGQRTRQHRVGRRPQCGIEGQRE